MRVNYLLIDYENVQPEMIPPLNPDVIAVRIFLGAHQNKVPLSLVKVVQSLGKRGQWIQIPASGKNALDFHIAFHIGEITATDPEAYIHVISKDTGFDPLLAHLKKERKIPAFRYESLDLVPILKSNGAHLLKDRVNLVVAHFQQPKTTKPRTRATLSNQVASLFQKSLSQTEVNGLIDELFRRELVVLNGTKLEHHWPAPPSLGTPDADLRATSPTVVA
jgi:hypothetical protein